MNLGLWGSISPKTILGAIARGGGGAAEIPWYEAAGVEPIAAYRAIGAANQAASYVNLKNPGTNDLTVIGSGMTWDIDNGLKSSGAVLGTGITFGENYTVVVRVAGCASNTRGPITGASNGKLYMAPNSSGNVSYGEPFTSATGAGITDGILAISATTAYVDATALPQALAYNGTGVELILCAYNGSANFWSAGFLCAAAVYDTALDATQLTALRAAMNGLTP